MPTAKYIDNQAELEQLARSLYDEPLLAVDTESNSMYVYQERVCLIQLSTRSQDYIIDPFSIDDFSSLGKLMASERIEKVFHAAEYDIMCLKRDFCFDFNNVFDTMIAARICGLEPYGLGTMLETFVGIELDKSHQKDDWGVRPLDPESLSYAQCDTHFLPLLRDELFHELERQERLLEASELFKEVTLVPAATLREYDPNTFWRVAQSHYLKADELRILRELTQMREELAQEMDRPPHKVIDNSTLINMAVQAPMTLKALHQIKGLNRNLVGKKGKIILQAIKRGREADDKLIRPRHHPPDPIVTERYTALHTWRKERALERGVESDVIVSRQTLWDLAHKDPRSIDELSSVQGIGPWRIENYGYEIIAVLNESRGWSQ